MRNTTESKALMTLYRKAITRVEKIKPLTLHVNCSLHIDVASTWFDITIFNNGSHNRTFYFLPRHDAIKNAQKLQDIIDLIKADNFSAISEYKKRVLV